MTAEVIDQITGDPLLETWSLEMFLLAILDHHDGLCLDNEPERLRLATALTTALTTVACELHEFGFIAVTSAWLACEQEEMFPPPTLQ